MKYLRMRNLNTNLKFFLCNNFLLVIFAIVYKTDFNFMEILNMEILNMEILNMEILYHFLCISVSLLVLSLTIKKSLLLRNTSLCNIKKNVKNSVNDLWIKYFIIRFNPNKIMFYRGLLNIAVIILVNYLFANEYCNPNLFAQENVQSAVKVDLDNSSQLFADTENDKIFSVKQAKKVINKARYLADLTLKDIDFEAEKDKLPVFPLYPDNAFDYKDEPLTLGPMPMVPENNIYEGPTKYGWHDPVDKEGSGFYVFDWKEFDRHDIDLIVEAMFENEEIPFDQQLEKDYIDEDLYWDGYDTDPPYWYWRKKQFIYDFDQWDSIVVKKLLWDWDWYGTSRSSAYYYNLYWSHPFEVEDYDQAECIENVFDRTDLQESYGIGDRPARYEFFLSLLERGFDTEPIPQAEKLKKRAIDSYVSAVPFTVSCIFFALFGGTWYIYDQMYNKDFFEEFRQTTPFYNRYTAISNSRKSASTHTDQLAGVLYGWNRKETVEWRIYYDETYVNTLERRNLTYLQMENEFEDRVMSYWLAKMQLNSDRYWGFWRKYYNRYPWVAFYKVHPLTVNPHWNYWIEEEPIEYSFMTDYKRALHIDPYEAQEDLILVKELSKAFHSEIKSFERWAESTMMPEDFVPLRQSLIDHNVAKGGELKDEAYEDDLEEFLAEQMEELYELRGVGVGLGKPGYEDLWDEYDFDDFDDLDIDYLFNMAELRDIL